MEIRTPQLPQHLKTGWTPLFQVFLHSLGWAPWLHARQVAWQVFEKSWLSFAWYWWLVRKSAERKTSTISAWVRQERYGKIKFVQWSQCTNSPFCLCVFPGDNAAASHMASSWDWPPRHLRWEQNMFFLNEALPFCPSPPLGKLASLRFQASRFAFCPRLWESHSSASPDLCRGKRCIG